MCNRCTRASDIAILAQGDSTATIALHQVLTSTMLPFNYPDISGLSWTRNSLTAIAAQNCENAHPDVKPALEEIELCTLMLVEVKFFEFIDATLYQSPNDVRRLLSHFGAVRGLELAENWREGSHDAGNIIYAGLWSTMMGGADNSLACQNLHGYNNAGHMMEAMLGIAWLHGWMSYLGPFGYGAALGDTRPRTTEMLKEHISTTMRGWVEMTGDTLDTAINLVITLGCAMYAVTPHLERALGAYAAVYHRCPWIQTTKRNYNYVRQREHVEALRHGYSSAAVFLDYVDWNRSGMHVSPVASGRASVIMRMTTW